MSQLLNPAYGSHTVEGVLETHTCGECGIHFAMPEAFLDARRRDGKNFYCPNGHSRVFTETEAQRLKRQLEVQRQRAAAEADLRRDTERRLAAQRGATTRAKRRHAAAVCPCCNRSFVQLRRHMATKHPDYRPTA